MDVVRRGPEDCWCEEGGLDGAQEEEEELFQTAVYVPNHTGCGNNSVNSPVTFQLRILENESVPLKKTV